MTQIRIMGGVFALSALAIGCGSSTAPSAERLIGRWLAHDLQVNGVDRNLTGPGASGLGQLDFTGDGTATIWLWFDGHLSNIPFPNEWRAEGSRLLIGPDLDVGSAFSPTFSVGKDFLVFTFEEPQQNGIRTEVWRYSRVIP